jgi:uncharacterized protein with NRDE domain
MCVIFFAYEVHPRYPLILLANRDEFYDRPTEKARYWKDFPDIYAGRDLVGGGTWLGVSRKGRFSAVTNFRDPNARTGTISRGNLVADFLKTDEPAENYLKNIQSRSSDFSGFNLLAGEINSAKNELFYFSNCGGEIKKLSAGIYGLSNHLLDTPWRKIEMGKEIFAAILKQKSFSDELFFELLSDDILADDADLPDTGIGFEREKLLSSIFIKTPIYGTRCSTVLKFERDFKFDFDERVFI